MLYSSSNKSPILKTEIIKKITEVTIRHELSEKPINLLKNAYIRNPIGHSIITINIQEK